MHANVVSTRDDDVTIFDRAKAERLYYRIR